MQQRLVPLSTNRLIIRELAVSDIEAVFDTLGPETSGGRVFEKKTLTEASLWLQKRMMEQENLGYSVWAVETKNGEFVGVCGIIPWKPSPMICYVVRKKFQSNGFATEAAGAVMNCAVGQFGSVIATVRDSNTASIRVAEKIGMRVSEEAFSEEPTIISYVCP